jgi:hypothetical protein
MLESSLQESRFLSGLVHARLRDDRESVVPKKQSHDAAREKARACETGAGLECR